MSQELAAKLTDPGMLIAVFVAIAVFATFYTIAVPFFERGDLNKRMKAVSTEREQIRARERARMNTEAAGAKASLRSQNNRSVRQIGSRRVTQTTSVTSAISPSSWTADAPPPTTTVRRPRKCSAPG